MIGITQVRVQHEDGAIFPDAQIDDDARMSLMELLRFDATIDELVARRATQQEIMKGAAATGYMTMAEDGVRRVLQGVTSMDEVSRVLDLTEGIA